MFPVQIKQLKSNAKDTPDGVAWDTDDPRSSPTTPRAISTTEFDNLEPSEPVNLNADGTQITDPETKPNHILYNSMKPVNLYQITDKYGRRIFPITLTVPTFPITPTSVPDEPLPTSSS